MAETMTATADGGMDKGNAPGPRVSVGVIIAVVVALAGVGLLFADPLVELERLWSKREEYSHGYLIPLISLFLLWQKRYDLARTEMTGSWAGAGVLLFGLVMYVMGDLGTLYVIEHYAFVVVLFGLAWAVAGTRAMRVLWIPIAFLIFMVPLPPFLYNNLSQHLQLISSELGVLVIRLFGISVFLEGNVIDLGVYKLQVVEACDGLRYLFPLMSFGFLAAYMFNAPLWQRAVVFLSTMPITVLMNSFRIGVIGVLVDNFGIEHAEGFLHAFEGWIIFMACIGILLLEMLLLMRLSGEKRPFREVFGLDIPEAPAEKGAVLPRRLSRPFGVGVVLVVATAAGSLFLEERSEIIPERAELDGFALTLGPWEGRRDTIEDIYLEALDHPDYIIADYRKGSAWVNFYVAYYPSQRSGAAAHSPRSCIPGGGWEISSIQRHRLTDVRFDGEPLEVNRLQIERGEYKQLVYYWFKQRDRRLTSEYLVKWFLFWDALTRNRTDGALIRLTTLLEPGEDWARADQRLVEFASHLPGRIVDHVPD